MSRAADHSAAEPHLRPRRRVLAGLAASALAAPLIGRHTGAQAAPQVTLRLHHFLPARTTGQAMMFEPWAQTLKEKSEGRLAVEIFPSMSLGGAPPQLIDQARDGIVDIVWTLPGYTPGRFPLIEAFELPFIAGSATANSVALAAFGDKHLRREFADVEVLAFWAHDPGHLHLVSKPVERLEDLKGLKLRFPTRQANAALQALGADTVGMPAPQVPEALAKGVIDGAALPWEVIPALKVNELCRHHTEITGLPGFYAATFVLAMNRRRYEGLPAELRAVLDAHSRAPLSRAGGIAWDQSAIKGRASAEGRGNRILQLAPAEIARWREATAPVADAWVKQVSEKGHDGAALLAEARALIAAAV